MQNEIAWTLLATARSNLERVALEHDRNHLGTGGAESRSGRADDVIDRDSLGPVMACSPMGSAEAGGLPFDPAVTASGVPYCFDGQAERQYVFPKQSAGITVACGDADRFEFACSRN